MKKTVLTKYLAGLLFVLMVVSFADSALATYYIRDDASGGQCGSIGTWYAGSKTCSMNRSVYTSDSHGIVIEGNGITLDGNMYSLRSSGPGVFGVWIKSGLGVTVRDIVVDTFQYGIYVSQVNQATVTGTTTTNGTDGIYVSLSGATLTGNTALYNNSGIRCYKSACGVHDNTVLNNNVGVFFDRRVNGVISDNTFQDNNIGLNLYYVSSGIIYNNSFVGNPAQMAMDGSSTANFNPSAPNGGGNYWNDFDTPEEGCNDLDINGICDLPYYLNGGSDGLPWVAQYRWLYDNDADGFLARDECNDGDPGVNPAAAEIPYNGIDENCNGMADDDDLDHDGHGIAEDCNDNDNTIYNGAPETKHDGIDQDCNGYDLTIDIAKATYSVEDDLLKVKATSALNEMADLVLEGYGPMVWTGLKWEITVENAGGDPVTVTVTGIEGSESAPTRNNEP